MNFTEHPAFVFPFVVGMLFIFIYLPVIYVTWLRKNSKSMKPSPQTMKV